MNQRTFQTLELEALLQLLVRHVQTPLGRKRVAQLSPSTDPLWLQRELQRTTECVDYLTTGGAFGLGEITDPESSLAQLQIMGTSLEPLELLALQSLVAVGADLAAQFNQTEIRARYQELFSITAKIPDLRRMLATIRGKILPNGEIDDNASPELRRIRREINDRRNRIYRNLEALMRDRSGSVQDEIVTVRNGRFVIPIRTDARGQVPGVMHGLSSSGQTTYVEPLAVIEQNNEMTRLREQEEAEIAQILFHISETLRANLPGIHQIVAALAEMDFTQAKARLSLQFHCVAPQLQNGRGLLLKEARHPLLEQNLKQTGGRIVPITLEMDEEHLTLVVSGPNAGGKTVVTKTVGMIALMAQMGLHVPATQAALPIFTQILADIGDQQSIAANLSTFTAHMKNIAEMMALVAPPALILLDEVGTGTDPDEGAALGIAIVKHFQQRGATTIATTHYNPLKVWASQATQVLNGSVEFDEQTLRPTFRLLVGIAGASAGLAIARRMEVPAEVIEDAKAQLNPQHLEANDYVKRLKALVDEQEALRIALEEERQATAEKYSQLDLEFVRKEAARRKQFEEELARVISDFKRESAQLLQAVQDKVAAARVKKEAETRAAELRRSAGVRLRKQVAATTSSSAAPTAPSSAPLPEPPTVAESPGQFEEESAEIRERDRVRLLTLNQDGTVESINDGTYTILIGSLRFRAKREELKLLQTATPTPKAAASLPKGVSASFQVDEDFAQELNIIGTKVDEAEDRVDKFLDAAFMAGLETIRIVHGHGKGALRQAVANLLKGHTHVKSFTLAPANEGGAGATIVVLKR
ncbi:MAG: endonuclease MutS2 [Acidobacteria bacterium]|nr:endonuclease MutS2 [Acidobacteriota bacterium]